MPSASNSSIFRFLEEVTPGTIESGGPQIYRVMGGTLSQSTESVEDQELRSDRGKGDSTLVSGSVTGNFDVQWSHKTHDEFLSALLADDYVEGGSDSVTTVADMVFTGSSTITSATTALPDLAKGQYFQISGANTVANNGIYKCSDSVEPTTASIAVDTAVKDTAADTSSSTVLSSARVQQSNDTLKTFTIEREMSDVTQFLTWAGVYVSSLSLNYAIGSQLTGSFGFLGTESEAQGTASDFPGISSEVAATTTPAFNVVTGTTVLLDGSSMGASCLESLSVDIQANLRERRCIGGGLSASSIGLDPFTITFTANIYFGSDESAAIYAKKLSDTVLTLSAVVTDADGQGMAITFPRAKITSAEIDGGSMGSDVMLSLSATASTDPTFGTQIIFDRLGSSA